MAYDPATDHYVPIDWDAAFALAGETLRGLDSPNRAAFYTSGRLGNEASFLYQWFVREFGTNNFPDCANMCHEASGVALRAAIGTNKGTVDLEDWEQADAIFLLGVNAASNAPRMLTSLAEAHKRGAAIVHINPIVEAAATRTIVPHDLVDMARFRATPTSTLNVQPRIGGDAALIRGVAKALFEMARDDPEAIDQRLPRPLHDRGSMRTAPLCEAADWAELERQSGVSEAQIREIASIYRNAKAAIIGWCLGISQQEHGVDTVREIANLLLLRGNIGRPGAGPCPIRGHSNVAGQPHPGHQPPPAGRAARPHRRRLPDHPAARAGAGRGRHDPGHARRRGEGVRGHGRQLRAGHAGHPLQLRGPAPLRAHHPGLDQAQPEPSGARPAGADPALRGPERTGRAGGRAAVDHGRGLDEHGPPLDREEGTGLAAPALGAGDHRRAGAGRPAGYADPVGGPGWQLRPDPRPDRHRPGRLRGLQPPGAPADRVPDPATGAGADLPHRSGRAEFSPARCPMPFPPTVG